MGGPPHLPYLGKYMPELAVMKDNRLLSEWPLDEKDIMIGRGPDCHIILEDSQVSWRHAKIVKAYGGYMVEDLGSTNGLTVNSRRVNKQMLKYGDVVKIGAHDLCFKMALGDAYKAPTEKTERVDAPSVGSTAATPKPGVGGARVRFLTGPESGVTKLIDSSSYMIGKGGDLATINRIGNTYTLKRVVGQATTVNDTPLTGDSRVLKNGDKIQVGKDELRFLSE